MHGTITKFRSDLGIGVIAADNGRKYRFSRQNVLNPRGDLVGHTVDFVGSSTSPRDIVVMAGSAWNVFAGAGN